MTKWPAYILVVASSLISYMMTLIIYLSDPIHEQSNISFMFGAVFTATVFTGFWNISGNQSMGVPLGALTLGVNSAFYEVFLSDENFCMTQKAITQFQSSVRPLWLTVEIVLIILIVVGIYAWNPKAASST